jgi:tetratricopeptide (TPR) repeat protein
MVTDLRNGLAMLNVNASFNLNHSNRRLKDAVKFGRTALDLCRGLTAEYPDGAGYQQILAQSLMAAAGAIGAVEAEKTPKKMDQAQIQEAEKLYRECIDVLQRLANRFPDEPDHLHKLGGTLHHLADLLTKRGDEPTEARVLLERAIDLQHAALKARPRQLNYLKFLANHYHNIINIDFQEADGLIQRSCYGAVDHVCDRIHARLVQMNTDFSEQPTYYVRIGNIYIKLGNIYRQTNQLAKEIEAWRGAVKYMPHFANAHDFLGHALIRAGQMEEGQTEIRRALSLNADKKTPDPTGKKPDK